VRERASRATASPFRLRVAPNRWRARVKSHGGIARRELRKTVRERLRELVENAEEVWAAYLEALTANTADGAPDYRARYQAASALLAEAYGKPMQPTHEQGGVTFIVERPPRGEWEVGTGQTLLIRRP